MRLGLAGAVVLVALAGCSGAFPYGDGNSTTVTPAAVPEDRAIDPDVPGLDGESVDAARLGDVHVTSLTEIYTRVVYLTVTSDGERRFGYRSTETHGLATNESIRTRGYLGPALAAFVAVDGNATNVSERRYRAHGQESRRRNVDGSATVIQGEDPPPLSSPLNATDDRALVEAFLSNATVVEQTPLGSYRLQSLTVSPAVVPDPLGAPRNASVDAIVRSNGRLRYVSARYEATFRGDTVTVRVDVYWSPPTEPFLTPGWLADG